jgi:hypothetical protein
MFEGAIWVRSIEGLTLSNSLTEPDELTEVFDERRRQGEQSAKRLDVGPIVRKGYLGKETPLEGQNSR